VLEAPAYISSDLVHALPTPEMSEHLGSVARIRKVGPADAPAAGFYWYVIVKTKEGRRLRLWHAGSGGFPEDGEALVRWWNDGMQAGWASALAESDNLEEAPPEVVARLTPNLRHPRWKPLATPQGENGRVLVLEFAPGHDDETALLLAEKVSSENFHPGIRWERLGKVVASAREVNMEEAPAPGAVWLVLQDGEFAVWKRGAAAHEENRRRAGERGGSHPR
jgi:hypothetical protein